MWTLAAMVLFGIIAVSVLQQYSIAAVASLQARSHAEGVAVLSWKASEARSDDSAFVMTYCVNASSPQPFPVETINQLGPDKLTPFDGFRVTCLVEAICWPPPPLPFPTSTTYSPSPPCPKDYQTETPTRTISVSWGPVDGGRTLRQTVVNL